METFDPEGFVEAAAPTVGLTLILAECAAVGEQMARIHALSQCVMDFPLAAEDDIAPRFEP